MYLKDLEAIEELNNIKDSIVNSDEEITEDSNESDDSFTGEKSKRFSIDDIQTSDSSQKFGVADSVFKEINGLPSSLFFVPKTLAKIEIDDEVNLEKLRVNIGESRFVWIQHIFHEAFKCDEDEHKANRILIEDSKIPKIWSLAQVEQFDGSTLCLSGLKILQNSPVFDIQKLDSKIVIGDFRKDSNTVELPANLGEKLISKNPKFFLEDSI